MGFKSWQSYYLFSQEVTHGNRYIHSDDVKDFLSNVLETSKGRVKSVKSRTKFWRAQLGCEWRPLYLDDDDEKLMDQPVAFPAERMKPVSFEASEGRVNPKGIPCLYLATTKETAMAEVRPGLDSNITLALFETVKKLKLIDCSVHPPNEPRMYWEEPDDQKKEEAVWEAIDSAFSQPVTPSDKSSDYVPTQIIAELFKRKGFDGVLYRSALSDGLNLALFDIDAAEMQTSILCSVEKIHFTFGPLGSARY